MAGSLCGFSWLTGIVDEVAAGRQADIAVRTLVTLYMMLGYLPMAMYYLDRWTTEHFDEIARRFALDREPLLFPRSLAFEQIEVSASGRLRRYSDPCKAFLERLELLEKAAVPKGAYRRLVSVFFRSMS